MKVSNLKDANNLKISNKQYIEYLSWIFDAFCYFVTYALNLCAVFVFVLYLY